MQTKLQYIPKCKKIIASKMITVSLLIDFTSHMQFTLRHPPKSIMQKEQWIHKLELLV